MEGKNYSKEELKDVFYKAINWKDEFVKLNPYDYNCMFDNNGRVKGNKIISISNEMNADINGMDINEFEEGIRYFGEFCKDYTVEVEPRASGITVNGSVIESGCSNDIPSFKEILSVCEQYKKNHPVFKLNNVFGPRPVRKEPMSGYTIV